MRTKLPVLSALTALTLLAAPPASAYVQFVKSASADLDGDGKPEAISFQWEEGDDNFILKAGSVTTKGDSRGTDIHGLAVIDLDSSDKRKEIAVSRGVVAEDTRVYLYSFDGKSLKLLGSVPAVTEVKGNGILLSDTHMGNWTKRDKFVFDAKKGKVSWVPQELYYIGLEGTVTQPFALAASRTGKAPLTTLEQGSTIQVLAAAPPKKKEDKFLYLVKSANGLLGWSTDEELVRNTEGLYP